MLYRELFLLMLMLMLLLLLLLLSYIHVHMYIYMYVLPHGQIAHFKYSHIHLNLWFISNWFSFGLALFNFTTQALCYKFSFHMILSVVAFVIVVVAVVDVIIVYIPGYFIISCQVNYVGNL